MQERILTHYSLFSLNENFWGLDPDERKEVLKSFFKDVQSASEKCWLYQVYPAQTSFDFLVWSNVKAEEPEAPSQFMDNFARMTNRYRRYVSPSRFFWGMTKPSIYSKAKRSAQEIDPFADERLPYFIIYPFSKTADWYLKSREERQEMMNGHIRIGKTYADITQLLLYSFGLQDQEFVVAYETKDMARFSDLVYELRMTEARIYTLNDTPIISGFLKEPNELAKLFSGK